MLTIISFYTKDWLYRNYAETLANDCRSLEVPCRIEERASTGSYLKNTCIKPRFIRDMLRELKSPVLWIDCDGSLVQRPVFFDGLQVDFAARLMPEERVRTWHVGTMWFNYSPSVMRFIDKWIENTGLISDESGLERTWRQMKLKSSNIPPEYFRILKPHEEPQATDVICHRISNMAQKRKEVPIAIQLAKKGIL